MAALGQGSLMTALQAPKSKAPGVNRGRLNASPGVPRRASSGELLIAVPALSSK
jgi:hypothetical protein